MEWLWLVGKGVVIGFAIAAPVGPIGVLCIRRSLNDGLASGLVCGLGAASADTVYGAIASFGLVSIIGLLHDHQDLIRLVGGLLLCLFGVKLLLSAPTAEAQGNGSYRLAGAYVSCFLLALTNPATIFAFLAVFRWPRPGRRGGWLRRGFLADRRGLRRRRPLVAASERRRRLASRAFLAVRPDLGQPHLRDPGGGLRACRLGSLRRLAGDLRGRSEGPVRPEGG